MSMDSFVIKKRPAASDESSETPKKNKPSTSTSSGITYASKYAASEKTVRKWMLELNVDLELAIDKGMFITGNKTVKRESVVYHVKSEMHTRALSVKAACDKQKRCQPGDLEKGFKNIEIKNSDTLNKLFKTAYYVAAEERPFSDFPSLLQLQESNGLSLGDTYHNDKSAKNFIENIGGIFHDQVVSLLDKADYFSIFCDGSTDRSDSEKEVIMIKVLEDFYPKLKYFKLEEPENTKANGILAAIDHAFFVNDLQNYKQKTVGFCSDGASVMMGARRGVIQLMREEGNAEWILPVWCMAHRLELAVKDCFKSTYMDNVIELLESIYYFYKGSAKRFKEAKDIADLLGEHFLKPEKANGTRWVDHKLKAVSKLLKNWHIIISQMENYAEDNTNRSQDRAKVKGYLNKLRQHKMVLYIAFVKDVLNEVSKVSLLFQREDITVSSAVTKLQSVSSVLRNMIDNEGDQLVEIRNEIVDGKLRGHTLINIIQDQSLAADRARIVQSLLDCMNTRLENLTVEPIFTSCYAFDQKNWPLPENREALLLYGKDDVRVVFQRYEVILTNAGCDIIDALSQWTDLKFHVAGNPRYANLHPLLVWQMVSQMDQDKGDFNDILKIIHLTSVLPLSNASCERAFSTMNMIKSDWRCRLDTDTLDTLMKIKIAGVPLKEFDPRPAVYRWWHTGERQKRPTIKPYGARN
ncbi:zinc finger protein 862-like [Mya arenaria]|uniref:zinc finger protein 862-like n=1 Tax=Mya arenaria TaxID=6604 RepID=UPI0022E47CEE|nr:zinc finger protein 862-like [Mya arenaria]